MADQERNYDGDGQEGTPQRRGFQQFPQRATASMNWREKDSTPRTEPQQRSRGGGFGGYNSSPRETSDTRLYVGNLSYGAQKDDIIQFFNNNGFNPSNLTISIDPETGRNPSYCFADFETADEASRAINELNGHDLMGRTVKISPGVAKRSGFEQGGSRQYTPRSYGSPQQDAQSPSYNRSSGFSSYPRENQQSGQGSVKKVYVGGLPDLGDQTEVEKSMKSLFEQFGIETTYVSRIIAPHESKAAEPGDHYYCFVEVARPEDVDVVIENLDQKPSPYSADGVLKVNKAREQAKRTGSGFGNQGAGFRDRRTDAGRDWRSAKPADS